MYNPSHLYTVVVKNDTGTVVSHVPRMIMVVRWWMILVVRQKDGGLRVIDPVVRFKVTQGDFPHFVICFEILRFKVIDPGRIYPDTLTS